MCCTLQDGPLKNTEAPKANEKIILFSFFNSIFYSFYYGGWFLGVSPSLKVKKERDSLFPPKTSKLKLNQNNYNNSKNNPYNI